MFFPRVIILCTYREPQPQQNQEGATPQAPNPINWKSQPQKPNPRPQPQNPYPKTTINEQTWLKSMKYNTGKKYSAPHFDCDHLHQNLFPYKALNYMSVKKTDLWASFKHPSPHKTERNFSQKTQPWLGSRISLGVGGQLTPEICSKTENGTELWITWVDLILIHVHAHL